MKYILKQVVLSQLDKIASILESKGLVKCAYTIDKVSDWVEKSVIEEMKNSPHKDVRDAVAKMIADLRKQGITDEKTQNDIIKTKIMRQSLGPYSIRGK